MDNTLNTFTKGMIKDVAETLRPEESYEDAQDMKLNAGSSASEYIISNVKGNNLSFTIPNIPSIIKLGLKDYYNLPEPWVDSIKIIATSGTYVGNVFQGQYNDENDYFDQIENSLNNDFSFLNLNIARVGNVFRIWSETDNLISIDSVSYPNTRLINSIQQVQTNQQIIGWEAINESIYLFTTNDSSSVGGIGAIFKLNYNIVTLDTSINLIYTENVNFTTLYPIANPGGIVGIDETTFTRRIYWTDRLNDFRSINVADPNIMIINPAILRTSVDIILEKPILKDVLLGGSLPVGHYQFAFNLETSSGVITPYSHTSNSIYVSNADITSGYADYHGSDEGEISNNAIRIEINQIDTSYEYLNIIVLKKVSITSPTEIYKLLRQTITDDTLLYTYTGDEDASIINETQFNKFNNLFDKCYTIAKKDNILFAANTIGTRKDIDFDSRAYRFDKNGDIELKNSSGFSLSNVTPQQVLTSFGMDYNSDVINPDQSIYKYKADGITLGGQGPNISYEFTQRHYNVDARANQIRFSTEYPTGPTGGYAYPYRLPYSSSGDITNNLGENNIYNEGNRWSDFKSPFLSHYQKGYRREETYRFAFVPYKNGSEIYAKWIADIKMPSIWEDWDRYVEEDENLPGGIPNFGVENAADNNKIFPLTRVKSEGGPANCVTLGVKFTVNIPPELAKEIDGFRIKRVKLELLDRTVLAQGILHLTHYNIDKDKWYLQGGSEEGGFEDKFSLNGRKTSITSNTSYAGPLPYSGYVVTPESSDWIRDGSNVYSHPLVTFHSPDFLFGNPVNHIPGDKLKIVQGLGMSASTRDSQVDNSNKPAEKTVYHKIYNGSPCFGSQGVTHAIVDAQNITRDGEYLISNYQFVNRTNYILGFSGSRSIGAPTTVIALDGHLGIKFTTSCETLNVKRTNIPFAVRGYLQSYNYTIYVSDLIGDIISETNYAGVETTMRPDKFHANYIRENLSQYGGPDFSNRQANIYINTGTDITLKENQLSYTIKVYGGDTYVNIFDTLKVSKNYNTDELGMEPAGSLLDDNTTLTFSTEKAEYGKKRVSVGLYYPCESFVNTDMRHGYYLNGEQNPAGNMAGSTEEIPNAELFPLDYGEDFKYNYVFSAQMDTQKSFALPVGQPDIVKHPVRIWASNSKTYGEILDSWQHWDSEKYIDIEGDLGEIRQLITHGDQLNAWQENGFGIASVNERSLITDQAGSGVILGKSGVLPRFDYISEIIGSWHQFSFATSPNGVLFFDRKDGGLYLLGSQGLRDVSAGKVNSWLYKNTRGFILQNDAPTGQVSQTGISSTYDYVNKEFLITFFDRPSSPGIPFLFTIPFTLAYSDIADVFTSFRSFCPNMYINDNKNLFTLKPFSIPSEVYVHEQGDYGVFYDKDPSISSITTVVNKEPFITKIFDNIRWLTEVFLPDGTEVSDETFSSIETFNTYQTTGVKTVFKRLMREWKHAIQYQIDTKNRIRSHYVRQKFEFLNNNNKEFRLHYLMNLFRKIMK
jgi:hypothetical protein